MKFYFFIIFVLSTVSVAADVDKKTTANLGDKLDDNNIKASKELRVHEFKNKPDIKDQNATPAHLEERLREEEIQKVELQKIKN